MSRRSTVLLIPSPWSGDENDPVPWTYRWWCLAYRTTRRLRHRIGLHDYVYPPALTTGRCTWCGKNRQRAGGEKP